MIKRWNFSDKFKAAVAVQALRGDKTVQEIATKQQLHPTQVSTWKRQAIEGMAGVFSDKVKKAEIKDGEIKENTNLSLTHQCKLLKISRSSLRSGLIQFGLASC